MFARLVVGYVIALTAIVPLLADCMAPTHTPATFSAIGSCPLNPLAARAAGWWAFGVLVVWAIERAGRRVASSLRQAAGAVAAFVEANPRTGVVAAALISTVIATYPVLFLGRSFVSPNNGGTPLLYGEPPFAPGAADTVLEDTRGSDIWATTLQCVPYTRIQRAGLATGEIPLWNRYNAIGRPLWGQGLMFLMDPLHWVALAAPDPAPGWDLKFVAHRFVFAAGVGVAALAATGASLPSAIAAAATPFVGVYAYRLSHPAVFSLTYAPWVLLTWFRLARAGDLRQEVRASVMLAVTSSLLLVASTPKEGAITLLVTEATGALAVVIAAGSWRVRGRRLATAMVAGVAVALLTAPHWLIFLDTLRSSVTLYDTPYVAFAGIREAVGFFLSPLVPGTPTVGLHLLGLVLTIAAVTTATRLTDRPAVLACLLAAAAAVAVAFGAVPGSWLVAVPFLGRVGHIHDVLLTAALTSLLIAGAVGAETLLTSRRWRPSLVTVLTGTAGFWLAYRVSGMSPPDGFEWWAVLLVLPVAIALPFLLGALRGPRRLLPLAAAGAASAVLLFPGGLQVALGVAPVDKLLLQPRPRVALNRTSPAVDAVHRLAVEPTRVVGVDWVLLAGSQALYELEGLGGADPLEVSQYRELVDTAGIFRTSHWLTMVPTADVDRLAPLLDMLNVGFLLVRSDSRLQGFTELKMLGDDRVKALRRPSPWPRAFFVDGVTSYVDATDLLRQVKQQEKPFAAVQPLDGSAVQATRHLAAPSGLAVPATSYSLTVNSTRFHVRAPGPGVAVLGETYIRDDFRATLNGQPVEYFRVNHVFKAIAIPAAGDWEIRFEYRPKHWTEAWLAAFAGVLLLAGCVGATEIRYRKGTISSEYPAARASS